MNQRFRTFLSWSAWLGALFAVSYHLRFVFFAAYGQVHEHTALSRAFYFLTGLGHESFAVFFVVNGICAGNWALRPEKSARAARLAGAAVLTGLIVGGALDTLGTVLFNCSSLYSNFPEFTTVSLGWRAFFGNVLMLQPRAVPTFGSNAMLYLLAYLFWSNAILAAGAHAWRKGMPEKCFAAALALAAVLLLPARFLVWICIWALGVALAWIGEHGSFRPSLPAALAVFGASLLLSRWIGADAGLLPPPFGQLLISVKYAIPGAGFATLALSMYPLHRPSLRERPLHAGADEASRSLMVGASFIFFFHFPFVMLAGGMLADSGVWPLMQQPGPAGYVLFAATLALCLLLATAASRLVIRVAGVPTQRASQRR